MLPGTKCRCFRGTENFNPLLLSRYLSTSASKKFFTLGSSVVWYLVYLPNFLALETASSLTSCDITQKREGFQPEPKGIDRISRATHFYEEISHWEKQEMQERLGTEITLESAKGAFRYSTNSY